MSKFFYFTWSASLIWLVFQFVIKPWNEHRFRSTKHVMRFFEQLCILYYICICALQVVTVDRFSLNLVQTILSANLLDNSVGQKNPTIIFPPLERGRRPKFWFCYKWFCCSLIPLYINWFVWPVYKHRKTIIFKDEFINLFYKLIHKHGVY